MSRKELNEILDQRILTGGRELNQNRRREARKRVREALDCLPEWADDFRLMRRNGSSLTKQLRHKETGIWISVLQNYTQIIVDNLNRGLWVEVAEEGQTVTYTCNHGFKGSRKIRDLCKQKTAVGGCHLCLKANRESVFGTLTRKRRKWEAGLHDPQAPCYFYMHKLRDGSYIYGVSAVERLNYRMDQYKAAMGYAPRVVYLSKATELEMWTAEEVLKKGITRGLKHDCEASRTSGGKTEYLPETYTTSEAVRLIQEAREIVR